MGWAVVVVVAALQSPHADTTVDVTTNGLWAIKNLAARNAVNRGKFGEHGACAGACSFSMSPPDFN